MKKIAALLLCLSMLSAGALTAYAEEPDTAPGEATIGTEVPDSHKITITVTGNADVTVNGKEGTEFDVERLSQPELEIKAREGEKITKVLLGGEDITDKLIDGKLTLDPIYEDKALDIQVETEALPVDSSEPDSSAPDSSTPDSSKQDSSTSKSDSTKADNSTSTKPSENSTNNPVTGVIGTVSAGGLLAFGAIALIKRKDKDEE